MHLVNLFVSITDAVKTLIKNTKNVITLEGLIFRQGLKQADKINYHKNILLRASTTKKNNLYTFYMEGVVVIYKPVNTN